MKNFSILLLFLLGFGLESIQAQVYDSNGALIVPFDYTKKKWDSIYVSSLPKHITLKNLTKDDLRKFRNLMLQRQQSTDKPYEYSTFLIFNKIIADLNTQPDNAMNLEIKDLPSDYLLDFSASQSSMFQTYISNEDAIQMYLRVSKNVIQVDTSGYLLNINDNKLKLRLLQKIN